MNFNFVQIVLVFTGKTKIIILSNGTFMSIRFTLCFFLFANSSFSQVLSGEGSAQPSYKVDWEASSTIKISEIKKQLVLSFSGAHYDFSNSFLPNYKVKRPLAITVSSFSASLVNPLYTLLSKDEIALIDISLIGSEIKIESTVFTNQKKPYGIVSFVPIRRNALTNQYEKLVSFELGYTTITSEKSLRGRSIRVYAANSVLQNGDWYKISIASDGIYKLSYAFLKGMGIDMDNLPPKNIRIYGNGGEMLPELNSDLRIDDLVENAIHVEGEGDNVFDEEDYVLFYGKGANSWSYNNAACPNFSHKLNLYSDSAYYFINVDLGAGKRIATQASSSASVTSVVTSFDDYKFHEREDVNFIKSGRQWFGEYFENNSSYNFSFSFPNIDQTSPVTVKASVASRHFGGSALYSISSQSGSTSISVPSTFDDLYSNYANIVDACFSFNPNSSTVVVNVTKQTSDAVAWLNYIEVHARRQLKMDENQMSFRDVQSVGSGNVAQYNLLSTSPVTIWDITDMSNIRRQNVVTSGANNQFSLPSDILREFISYTGSAYLTPSFFGRVDNQNLHSLSNKNYIIITHPDFYAEALQLAEHHEVVDGLSSVVVTTEQVYNEFSSGAQDVCAIRDFVKMFYDKANTASEMPECLLLFGDGSYDNKNRFSNNTNYVPTYQSLNSTLPTASYVSDDFYGLLDDAEGLWRADAVDLGVGRFPVKTKVEAQTAVDKVLSYSKTGFASNEEKSTFGNWRNIVCFIGDDEDGALHTKQADQLATLVDTTYGSYNIEKVYLDAYKQEASPGGNRYPDAIDAINRRIDQGVLIINYTGHGGELGLAHERVVDVSQVNKWKNKNKLFLFYTASCEVSRYDDPVRTSAGEYAFLNPNGGAIALFSTVRVVYASPNFTLNKNFFKAAFEPINGKMPRLGDLYKYSKTQAGGNSVNSRNFTLIGDPALTLAYPKYTIVTDSINNVSIFSPNLDTLKALSLVTVTGHLNNEADVLLSSFNGVLYPTVYDKAQDIATLSNDGEVESPRMSFKLQKNVLYNGKVSVTNGKFEFSFVVPKDIAYQFGNGRISYYAENGSEDASGYFEDVVIGGSDDSAASDVNGPDVNLYLNDTKFVFGGLTDENPDLYSILSDEHGINTVGNGIGHDITAVLDGDVENIIVLNDYYQSDLDSYKSGSVRYPFSDIDVGKHSLKLKVWDVYNNSSETYTEFFVAKSAALALSHVLNYPNPFTTKTQFYFEHNQPHVSLNVQVQVFTVTGKLVKTINRLVNTEGYRSEPIEWDGRDDFGDRIGRGVYVYRIKVKLGEGSVVQKYEKLVILN